MIDLGALKSAISGTSTSTPATAPAQHTDEERRLRPNNPRVTFELTAEVDAETLIDAFGERCAIVIHDAGMTPEDARRIGLESLRKAYRVFKRGAVSM